MLTAIVAIFTLAIVTGLVSLIARGIRQERLEEAAQRGQRPGRPESTVIG